MVLFSASVKELFIFQDTYKLLSTHSVVSPKL